MNEIIETMARAIASRSEHYHGVNESAQRAMAKQYMIDAIDMLRAAKAEGWELCKLPERMEGISTYDDGWNDCLDEIERLELEGGDG